MRLLKHRPGKPRNGMCRSLTHRATSRLPRLLPPPMARSFLFAKLAGFRPFRRYNRYLYLTIVCPIQNGRPAQFFWKELLLQSSARCFQKLFVKALLGLAEIAWQFGTGDDGFRNR